MAETNRTWMRIQWRAHKLLWDASGGRLGRRIRGMPVLELVTTGHKSGLERRILISYVDDDGVPVLVGTNAGRGTDPAWVQNLRAQPVARARWDGQWRDVTALELTGDDHDRAWRLGVAHHPAYASFAESLTRPIPIVRLEPR